MGLDHQASYPSGVGHKEGVNQSVLQGDVVEVQLVVIQVFFLWWDLGLV